MNKTSVSQKSFMFIAAVVASMGVYSLFGIFSSSFAGDLELSGVNDSEQNIFWISNYKRAIDEARRTGKPIFLEFRCVP